MDGEVTIYTSLMIVFPLHFTVPDLLKVSAIVLIVGVERLKSICDFLFKTESQFSVKSRKTRPNNQTGKLPPCFL